MQHLSSYNRRAAYLQVFTVTESVRMMIIMLCCDLSAEGFNMCAINILLFLYVVYTLEFQLKVDLYQRIPKNSNFTGKQY